MNHEQFKRLRSMLIRHEGIRLKPYRDTVDKLTIGIGRNLDDVGITEAEANLMLKNDLDRVMQETLNEFPWFASLSFTRQDVVLSMVFNLGINRFKSFKKLIKALVVQNYQAAYMEMLDSTWAQQVGARAVELARMMLLDRYEA